MTDVRSLSALTLVALACGTPDEEFCATIGQSQPAGPVVRFADPTDGLADFVDHPFPSDALVRDGGTVRVGQFPNPTNSSTLQDFLQIFQTQIRGFSTSSALYVGFSEPMDPTSFPSDPGAALADDAPVYLVDIDPDSPHRGRRFPLRLRYEDQAKVYLPANHLVVLPPYGATLRGGTTYALVLTRRIRSRSGAPLVPSAHLQAGLSASCAGVGGGVLGRALAPLAVWLSDRPSEAAQMAAATVFTTRDVMNDLRALANQVRASPPAPPFGWRAVEPSRFAVRYEGTIELPGFQTGRRPYASITDGGALLRTADGFAVDHTETASLAISLPIRREMPPRGWPVVIFSHGTGGGYRSVFNAAIGDSLAARGIAAIGYDGTLHGPRDPTGANPNLTFFNIFNPIAARDNVLQGVADLVALTEVLPSIEVPAEVAGGTAVRFDRSRLAIVGHSQGALVAAPFASVDNTPRAVVLSGLGAILAITLLERTDIVDFRGLLTSLLRLPENDPLDVFHPVVNLLQQFIEPADPIAYARRLARNGGPGGSTSVLMVEGLRDFASPAEGQEAFSVAAQLPVVEPVARSPRAAQWFGPDAVPAPVAHNVETAAGRATYGLIQYPQEDHFPIFRNADANDRYVEFVRSALLDDIAVIEPQGAP